MIVQEVKRKNCIAWGETYSENINCDVSLENLIIVSDFLNKDPDNKYCIFFGTLLGYIRDGGFIQYDQDTDIALFDTSEDYISNLKSKLRKEGFYIFRDDAIMFSAVRRGEYIDFYKFYKIGKYFQNEHFIFPEELFINFSDTYLEGEHLVKIPESSDIVLELLYGKSWKTPIRSHHADGINNRKNTRLNSKIYLKLYSLYINAIEDNTIIGFVVRSKIVRLIAIIVNTVIDYMYRFIKFLKGNK